MIHVLLLWLPIIVSSVLLFIVSSIIHMAMPWHKKDYPKLSTEDKLMDALRPLNLPTGDYMVPRPTSMAEMRSPEFEEKRKKGPVLILTVLPNGISGMSKNLILWFVYILLVNYFTAYVLGHSLMVGAVSRLVFRVAFTVSFLGFSAALWQMSIWYSRSWIITIKSTIDGVIYALITAGTFVWFWPQ